MYIPRHPNRKCRNLSSSPQAPKGLEQEIRPMSPTFVVVHLVVVVVVVVVVVDVGAVVISAAMFTWYTDRI